MTERVHLIDQEEKEKTLCRVHSPYELGKTNRKEEVTCRRCLTKIKNLGEFAPKTIYTPFPHALRTRKG